MVNDSRERKRAVVVALRVRYTMAEYRGTVVVLRYCSVAVCTTVVLRHCSVAVCTTALYCSSMYYGCTTAL
jgi:hypothetical protein